MAATAGALPQAGQAAVPCLQLNGGADALPLRVQRPCSLALGTLSRRGGIHRPVDALLDPLQGQGGKRRSRGQVWASEGLQNNCRLGLRSVRWGLGRKRFYTSPWLACSASQLQRPVSPWLTPALQQSSRTLFAHRPLHRPLPAAPRWPRPASPLERPPRQPGLRAAHRDKMPPPRAGTCVERGRPKAWAGTQSPPQFMGGSRSAMRRDRPTQAHAAPRQKWMPLWPRPHSPQ